MPSEVLAREDLIWARRSQRIGVERTRRFRWRVLCNDVVVFAETDDPVGDGGDNLVVRGGLTKRFRICPCKSSVHKELCFRHTLEEVDEAVCGRDVAERRDAWIL